MNPKTHLRLTTLSLTAALALAAAACSPLDVPSSTAPASAGQAAGTTQVQFTGTVEKMEAAAWTIDGRIAIVAPETEIKSEVQVGDQVEAAVTVRADGSLLLREVALESQGGLDNFNGNASDDNANGNGNVNGNASDDNANGNASDDNANGNSSDGNANGNGNTSDDNANANVNGNASDDNANGNDSSGKGGNDNNNDNSGSDDKGGSKP